MVKSVSSPLHNYIHSWKKWFLAQIGEKSRVTFSKITSDTIASSILYVLIASFIIQCLSGIVLTLDFAPTSSPMLSKQGRIQSYVLSRSLIVDEEKDTLALAGEYILRDAIPGDIIPSRSFITSAHQRNSLIHASILVSLHSWNTHLLIALMLFLPFYIAFRFSIQSEHRLVWSLWWLLCFIALTIVWTGYILPWNSFSATSYFIVTGFLQAAFDGTGGDSAAMMLGKYSPDIIARMFSLHAIVLPCILFLVTAFVYICVKPTIAYSRIRKYIGLLAVILFPIVFMLQYIKHYPGPADTLQPTMIETKPFWFFLPFHGITKVFPIDIAGYIGLFIPLFLLMFPRIKKNNVLVLSLTLFIFLLMLLAFIGS